MEFLVILNSSHFRVIIILNLYNYYYFIINLCNLEIVHSNKKNHMSLGKND